MRRRWMTVAVLGLMLVPVSALVAQQQATPAAQTGQGTEKPTSKPGETETPGPGSTKPEKPKTGGSGGTPGVAFTGCVQAGAAPGAYSLSNIKKGTGSTASAITGGDTVSYAAAKAGLKLTPSSGIDLTAHVGHQVEVFGTLSTDAAASSGDATAAPANNSTAKPADGSTMGKTLTVTSVKMIAASCSHGTD